MMFRKPPLPIPTEQTGHLRPDPDVCLQDLVFVTRLLQLALSARGQLQERRYCFPEASNLILRSFYPLLSTFMADSHISKLRVSPRSACLGNAFLVLLVF